MNSSVEGRLLTQHDEHVRVWEHAQFRELQEAIVDVDPSTVKSPALRRLIEEVRNPDEEWTRKMAKRIMFDRFHNRHNRSM